MEIHIHTTIGIGDNENDINMIECSDIGMQLGNAVKELKKKAEQNYSCKH